MNKRILKLTTIFLGSIFSLASCSKKNNSNNSAPVLTAKDPSTAPVVSVDRFSAAAGHLQVRSATNGLPAANAPVNFDQVPFTTKGFNPDGTSVDYYNFDLQPTTPAPIWVLYKKGQSSSVAGQLNIIDVVPGTVGYNDFWQVDSVTVPDSYVANSVTSYSEIVAQGYTITKTSNLVNCPVVPKGSTAAKRYNSSENSGIINGWYRDSVVCYFTFAERELTVTASGLVPVAPIYVTFNINPTQPNGGPASGFKADGSGVQTHNVIAVIPTDASYSPLWQVEVYNNTAFDSVSNLSTAASASLLNSNAGYVNCPVVDQ